MVYFILLFSADVECRSLLEVDRHLAPSYQAGKKSPTVPARLRRSNVDL